LIIIQAIIKSIFRREDKYETPELSAKNVALVLGGFEKASLLDVSFYMLKKGLRMAIFLIMPSFAWQKYGFKGSIKKGIFVLKTHLVEFTTGFTLTSAAAAVIFLPFFFLILIDNMGVDFPDWIWVISIIYIGFAWSFEIYLEQMFMADLYLWHLNWEREYKKAKKAGKKLPKLRDVPKPSILDEVPDLLRK
jgi:hypothetical protein